MAPGLLTDLYQLTMAQGYLEHGIEALATFSLSIRGYPPDRGYFVSAGLEDALDFLEGFGFSDDDIRHLSSTGIFSSSFLRHLRTVRFEGAVRALPEGRPFFADEPVLEVTAPIAQAQLVETQLISLVNLETLLATKASRAVHAAGGAAGGRDLVDFGLRRAQGADAAMKAARCGYMVGFQATSNVEAGRVHGIPVAGTMAHSFVTAFEDETDSFRAIARTFPQRSTLLIDTYDTAEGARRAVVVAREMRARGQALRGVRLDSGDLLALSREVRRTLDEAGFPGVRILASGGLDEHDVAALVSGGAPIDAFGVGTRVVTSADAPWTDMAYKLVRYGERPVLKLSEGKRTLPGPKQVFRFLDRGGMMVRDVIALVDEDVAGGEPLLETVMAGGKRTAPSPDMASLRRAFQVEFAALPERFKALRRPPLYPVGVSPRLAALTDSLTAALTRKGGPATTG